ncbi:MULTISPECIES: Fis family transcriptional regulator [Burkholderia]|uniref:Fis family transcriptional regulator n=1 Tax=Burkholderia sp. Ed8 TaxID=3112957 RepID=UPI00084F2523|nr:Fis family transcriptional regulator [Burkholderia sp. Tr-20355]MBN3737688.1 Fis family transcriptional regulator [Burkholderia sp. Tr-20355]RQS68318.1 Fis family transcriptional regulator [Burkholderia seminalis]
MPVEWNVNKWAHRLSQSSRTQREAKTELLPLPRPIRDALSLEYHLQLEALHAGVGSLVALQVLMRTVIATGILCEYGYGDVEDASYKDLEKIANHAFSSGCQGHFHFDGDAFHLFARVLTTHDLQLEVAPVKVIDEVAKRLQRYCTATR